MKNRRLMRGDSQLKLKLLDKNSVDAVVTDPPYGLAFLNKKWDYDVPSVALWKEVLRVLKPGGHALVACGTRTQHKMVSNLEEAGFEIRDVVAWIYGQGFPKNLDVSKAIDKKLGAKRKVIGANPNHRDSSNSSSLHFRSADAKPHDSAIVGALTEPATEEARQWQGFGSALKPAMELWTLVRKPLHKNIASNVLRYGTGALNIDACRIQTTDDNRRDSVSGYDGMTGTTGFAIRPRRKDEMKKQDGRFPANVILDEEAGQILDAQSRAGGMHSAGVRREPGNEFTKEHSVFGVGRVAGGSARIGDDGGASRFFYCAKASQGERSTGLDGMPKVLRTDAEGMIMDHLGAKNPTGRVGNENFHPTVKPIRLMEYLCKLITPPGGLILDPFMGSGTTGIAAKNLRFKFVGVEKNRHYFKIAKKRIKYAKREKPEKPDSAIAAATSKMKPLFGKKS
jgi:site-specific DNA-methyltransferase (adenine-specific)